MSLATRKRNYSFQRTKNSGKHDHVEKYKRMKNRVTTMLRSSFLTISILTLTSSSGRQSSVSASKAPPSQISPATMLYPLCNKYVYQEKMNMLNGYFSKCFNRSQPSLETTDCLNKPLADDYPDEILCTVRNN